MIMVNNSSSLGPVWSQAPVLAVQMPTLSELPYRTANWANELLLAEVTFFGWYAALYLFWVLTQRDGTYYILHLYY